jgi:uncharacterized protein (TIGR03435 family)
MNARYVIRSLLFLSITAALSLPSLQGQRAAPAFEVTTVKPYTGEPKPPTNTFLAGGRYVASAATLKSIIALAYQPLVPRQIVGGPAWIETPMEMFDVQAKAGGNPPVDTLRAMLQALLADRFKLRTHVEKRDSPIFALVPARADGRLGPQLKPAPVDCSNRLSDSPPPDEAPQPLSTNCAFFTRVTNFVGVGLQFSASAKGVTMAQLAAQLTAANAVGRVVLDRTGLTGFYDVDVNFAGTPAPGLNAPSVFTAVEEQLGLKLESTTAPIDFLVIDSVDRPSAD